MAFFEYFTLFIAILTTVLYVFQSFITILSIIVLKDSYIDHGWLARLIYLVISIISWLVLHHEGVIFS